MSVGPVEKSGMVTGVGLAYLIYGGLIIVMGLAIMVGGAAIGALFFGGASAVSEEAIKKIDADPNLTPEQKKEAKENLQKLGQAGGAAAGGFLAAFGAILGICTMITGLPLFLGGLGVVQRKQWGRILTLIFAFLMALGGLWGTYGSLNPFVPLGLIINLVAAALGIWAIVVLLNSGYAAEFNVRRAD
jgi:hypothetical protein